MLAFAGLLAAQGHARLAVCLAGSAMALRDSLGVLMTPGEEASFAQWLAPARRDLGPRAADESWAKGRALRVEHALEMALTAPDGTAPGAPARRPDPLTSREREVAGLVARGLSNRQIAAALVISERTADGHVANILSKLSLSSRVQVAVWAVEHPLT